MKKNDYINPKYEPLVAHIDELMPLFRESISAGRSVKLSPTGISMMPMLRQGIDTVTLSPVTEKLKKYDIPFYLRENGQYVLHRIVRVGDDSYTCIGDNQFIYEKNVAHASVIAVVTSFTRKGKSYSVSSLPYRIYCRLWHYSRGLRHFWRRGKGWLRRHLK